MLPELYRLGGVVSPVLISKFEMVNSCPFFNPFKYGT